MRKLAGILIFVALLAGCESGDSKRAVSPELQRQQDAAFQAMMAQPGNIELSLAYAGAATRAGDYESAIGAYEGVLMTDPSQTRVKLELGILYFRLKSYEMSRTYLEQALQSPTLSPDLRKPAEELLAKMPAQSSTRRS